VFPRPNLPARWLKVSAPPFAAVNADYPVEIRLATADPELFLSADLHWATTRREPRLLLSGGGPQPVGSNPVHRFSIPVPSVDDLGFVRLIIYLSRDGHWTNRVRSAATDYIPVRKEALSSGVMVPTVARSPRRDPAAPPMQVVGIRWLTAAVWMMAAAAAGMRLRTRRSLVPERPPFFGRLVVLAFLLAALWEIVGVESLVGQTGRALAFEHRLYYLRTPAQKALSATAAIITAAAVWLVLRNQLAVWIRVGLVTVALFFGIGMASLLSLHAIDLWANATWAGVPHGQIVKLILAFLAASLTAVSALASRRFGTAAD
jgi:hypothetical protein